MRLWFGQLTASGDYLRVMVITVLCLLAAL